MTTPEIRTLRTACAEEFRIQMTQMGVKKTQLEDLCAGFEDGMTAMLVSLRQEGWLLVDEERSVDKLTPWQIDRLRRNCSGHAIAACRRCRAAFEFDELVKGDDTADDATSGTRCPYCGTDLRDAMDAHMEACDLYREDYYNERPAKEQP